jgi:hypothetical protein
VPRRKGSSLLQEKQKSDQEIHGEISRQKQGSLTRKTAGLLPTKQGEDEKVICLMAKEKRRKAKQASQSTLSQKHLLQTYRKS